MGIGLKFFWKRKRKNFITATGTVEETDLLPSLMVIFWFFVPVHSASTRSDNIILNDSPFEIVGYCPVSISSVYGYLLSSILRKRLGWMSFIMDCPMIKRYDPSLCQLSSLLDWLTQYSIIVGPTSPGLRIKK